MAEVNIRFSEDVIKVTELKVKQLGRIVQDGAGDGSTCGHIVLMTHAGMVDLDAAEVYTAEAAERVLVEILPEDTFVELRNGLD